MANWGLKVVWVDFCTVLLDKSAANTAAYYRSPPPGTFRDGGRSRSHILGIFELIIKQSGSKGSDRLGEIFPITSRSRLCSFPSIPSFHTRPCRSSPAPKSELPTTPWVACGRGTIGLIWSCRRLTLYFKSRDMSVLRKLGLVGSFGGQRP